MSDVKFNWNRKPDTCVHQYFAVVTDQIEHVLDENYCTFVHGVHTLANIANTGRFHVQTAQMTDMHDVNNLHSNLQRHP